jgi:hypothetical protein
MQSSDIPVFALVVSFVATLLSSFSLVLHWKNYRRDEGKLNVKVKIKEFGFEKPHLNPFELTITNMGRRPIRVDSWYVRSKDGGDHKMIDPKRYRLPAKLEEAEEFEEIWMLRHIPDYLNLDTVFAVDATGKKWEISKQNRKAILEYLERMPKPGS